MIHTRWGRFFLNGAMTGLTMNLSRKQLDVGSGSRLCEINDDSAAIWPEDSMTRFARLFPNG
jgi:hypothetical protein